MDFFLAVCPIFSPLLYSQHVGCAVEVCTLAIYSPPPSTKANGMKHPGNGKGLIIADTFPIDVCVLAT